MDDILYFIQLDREAMKERERMEGLALGGEQFGGTRREKMRRRRSSYYNDDEVVPEDAVILEEQILPLEFSIKFPVLNEGSLIAQLLSVVDDSAHLLGVSTFALSV